ncbi:MAG: hypothetical protein NTZ10_01885 [Candidatus Saganbacteria bacterium]|nr:hypothetical protein [Candidatus Saganbacteria bacterium]
MAKLISPAELSTRFRPQMVQAFGVRLPIPRAISSRAPQWIQSEISATGCLRPQHDRLAGDVSPEKISKFYAIPQALTGLRFDLKISTDTQGRILPSLFRPNNFAVLPGSAVEFSDILYGRTAAAFFDHPQDGLQVRREPLYEHLYRLDTLDPPDGHGILVAVFQFGVISNTKDGSDSSNYDAGEGWWPLVLSLKTPVDE